MDNYDEDQFDDDEAQELQTDGQLNQEQKQLLAVSGPDNNMVNSEGD